MLEVGFRSKGLERREGTSTRLWSRTPETAFMHPRPATPPTHTATAADPSR